MRKVQTNPTVTSNPWIRKTNGDTCVIFIHGILSSDETAWQRANNKSWPALLAEDQTLKNLAIYNFTYRSDMLSGNYGPQDAANDLAATLKDEGLLIKRRLIFVCHSMGGIVVRRCLVDLATDLMSDYSTIEIGVLLVASPSLGSDLGNRFTNIASFLRIKNLHSQALRSGVDNQWLMSLHQQFRKLIDNNQISMERNC